MLSFVLIISLIFWSSAEVQAQIMINELLPDLPSEQDENQLEWVELINVTSDQTIDITNFVLKDLAGNTLIITADHVETTTEIAPQSYITIYRNGSKFSLNNLSDEIFLYESTHSSSPLDHIAYNSSKTNESIGRLPDGIGEVIVGLIPTPGKPNQPLPTPPPKPTTSPTPNQISVAPTRNPKTASTPKPILTPEPDSISQKNLDEDLAQALDQTARTDLDLVEATDSSRSPILGLFDSESSLSARSETVVPDDLAKVDIKPRTAYYFAAGGLSLLSLALWRARKVILN